MAENNNAPVSREEFEILQSKLAALETRAVSKDEFLALEGAVNTTVDALAKKAASSVTMQKPEEAPKVAAPKSFEIKGVGKVRCKYPSFQIGKAIYSCSDVEKDAKLAAELYAKHPNIFVNLKNG
jgi:hypothetical protein